MTYTKGLIPADKYLAQDGRVYSATIPCGVGHPTFAHVAGMGLMDDATARARGFVKVTHVTCDRPLGHDGGFHMSSAYQVRWQ